VIDECFSESFSIIVSVFGEKEHYRHPNIIRSNLQITMIHIGFVKSSEKSIITLFTQTTAFIIEENFLCLLARP
jgi:hypothetical protein